MREIGRKGAGEFRGFPILYVMDENNRRCLPDGRKEMQIPGKIENPCQSEEGALAWDRQLYLGQRQWTRRGLWQLQEI